MKRTLFPLGAFFLCVAAAIYFAWAAHAQGPDLDKPLQTIDDDITAFAMAPDGRIVYSVRHIMKTRLYDLQRDDIWLQESNGKRKRLVQGERLFHSSGIFSYTVNSFRWSPDGRLILAQLFTTFVTDERGNTRDAQLALLMEDSGKQIKIGDSKDTLFEATDVGWLGDNQTIVFLNEVVKPRILFGLNSLRYASGRGGAIFSGRTFLDAAWLPSTNEAIVVERDRNLSGPPRLQRFDLVKETDVELATLDDYTGGLSVSPSGKKAAYFIDQEVLEVRDLTDPKRIARLRVGLGVVQWSPDETRILLKRAPEKKSGDIVWINLPPLTVPVAGKEIPVVEPTPEPILHDLTFRDFAISPDGRTLAVVNPGKHNLLLYPLPTR
jgi:dipeptidyl aminopeptidase/acylaminoacyl peptidase